MARYKITEHKAGKGRAKYANRIGTLIAEYDHFFLFQVKKYRYTVNKNALHCGHYSMKKL